MEKQHIFFFNKDFFTENLKKCGFLLGEKIINKTTKTVSISISMLDIFSNEPHERAHKILPESPILINFSSIGSMMIEGIRNRLRNSTPRRKTFILEEDFFELKKMLKIFKNEKYRIIIPKIKDRLVVLINIDLKINKYIFMLLKILYKKDPFKIIIAVVFADEAEIKKIKKVFPKVEVVFLSSSSAFDQKNNKTSECL